MFNVIYLNSDCWMPFVASWEGYRGLSKAVVLVYDQTFQAFYWSWTENWWSNIYNLPRSYQGWIEGPGPQWSSVTRWGCLQGHGIRWKLTFLTVHTMLLFLGTGFDKYFINQGLARTTKSPSLKMTLTMMTGPRGQPRKMTKTRSRQKKRRAERKSRPFLAESLARIKRLRHPNYLRGRSLAKGWSV